MHYLFYMPLLFFPPFRILLFFKVPFLLLCSQYLDLCFFSLFYTFFLPLFAQIAHSLSYPS